MPESRVSIFSGDDDGDKTSAGGALDEEEESLAESTSTRDESISVSATPTPTPTPTPTSVGEEGRFPFPSATDLNNRIRRLVTCYQRSYKKEEMRLAARARVSFGQQIISYVITPEHRSGILHGFCYHLKTTALAVLSLTKGETDAQMM